MHDTEVCPFRNQLWLAVYYMYELVSLGISALPPDLGSTYSWGKNSAGQLGLGHTDDRWTPQVVR